MSPLVYIVRHGQTEWNAEFRLQGQSDIELNDTGRAQARGNGLLLRSLIEVPQRFDFVASPMHRTRETMELVREAMGLDRSGYRTDASLVEVNFGDWQGFTIAELEARNPGSTRKRDIAKWEFLPPGIGAESYDMLQERVRPWFEALDRDTICVAHGGVMRAIFRLAMRMPKNEAAALEIPQDRVLRLFDGNVEWLPAGGTLAPVAP